MCSVCVGGSLTRLSLSQNISSKAFVALLLTFICAGVMEKVSIQVETFSKNQLCRLCANSDYYMLSIFEGEGLEQEIEMKIHKYLPIQLERRKKVSRPPNICSTRNRGSMKDISTNYGDEPTSSALTKFRIKRNIEPKTILCESESDDINESMPSIKVEGDIKIVESLSNSEEFIVGRDGDDETVKYQSRKKFETSENDSFTACKQESLSNNSESGEDSSLQINNSEVKYSGNLDQDICTSADDKSSKIVKLEEIAQKSTPQLTLIGPPGYTRVNNFVGLPIIAVTAFSCEVCHTTFTDTLALAGHKMAAHSGSKFQCNFCELEFNNNNQLEEHEKIHKSRTLECPICGKTVGARGFKFHLNQHKNTNLFVCVTCVKVFPNESELKSHTSAHSHEKQHLCETCGKSFKIKTAMMEHLRVHLNDEDKEKFECDTCHTLYSSKNILKRHMILHDKAKEKKYACETCGKTFFKLPNLRLHIKVHSEDRPFKCSYCSMAFKWKKNLDTHTSIHGLATDNHSKDDERIRKATPRVQCEVCGKYLASKWNLSVHMKRHNGNFTGSHMCHICGKTLCDSQAMSRHLKVHMGIKPFECKICNKHFGTKMSRDDHERTHTGEKPFCCDLCGKCFGSKPHLHVHRAIHSDERPYHCPYCPKAFRRRPHLVLHVRTHTGEKPFACEVCSRAFVQKNDMTKHMLTHSSERPFVCECGVSFRQKRDLNRHKKKHTDVEPNILASLRNTLSSYDENSQSLHALEQGTALEGPLLFSLLRKLDGDTRHRFETSRGTNVSLPTKQLLLISQQLVVSPLFVEYWILLLKVLSSRNNVLNFYRSNALAPQDLPRAALSPDIKRKKTSFVLDDPTFDTPAPIDILLGADLFEKIMTDEQYILGKDLPIAFGTVFGVALMGPTPCSAPSAPQGHSNGVTTLLSTNDIDLHSSSQNFWKLEEPPHSCHRSIEKSLSIFGHHNFHCSAFSGFSGHLTDNFSYRMRVTGDAQKPTKCIILLIVAQIYDPCGWLTPVVFWAKYFIQLLWTLGLKWDEPLPADIAKNWERFLKNIIVLEAIRIPRPFYLASATNIQLHGFCGANETGYGCCLYPRCLDPDNKVTVFSSQNHADFTIETKGVTLPVLVLRGLGHRIIITWIGGLPLEPRVPGLIYRVDKIKNSTTIVRTNLGVKNFEKQLCHATIGTCWRNEDVVPGLGGEEIQTISGVSPVAERSCEEQREQLTKARHFKGESVECFADRIKRTNVNTYELGDDLVQNEVFKTFREAVERAIDVVEADRRPQERE
uniref:C2H2-type domain-containing protein n=1 Tax=Timema genevievae TaxID=629358 RepID=A0A7R9K7T3_TIMGE|nr:unnamed protein product [Timema genevievae]